MGKGDKKSRRGKIHIGSHGVRRPKKKGKLEIPVVAPVVDEKPKKAVKAKVEKVVETPVADTAVAEVQPKPKKPAKKTADKEKQE